jgi:oligoribonuclease NrnB/cAMP/cGMP phosphodiesterase (DHH superfamily)
MKCLFHKDNDGRASAAIVYKYYIREHRTLEDFKFIGINYDMEFPFSSIVQNELIVIVDFSLQNKGDFDKLLKITSNVIWIDHHKTAIAKHSDTELDGIRRNGTAGCALTWEFFYPEIEMPHAIKLIADYDVWTFQYGENTNYFQTSLSIYDTRPESEVWLTWLDPQYVTIEEINKGQELLDYRNILYKGFAKGSYFIDFRGYHCVICNSQIASSQLFDSIREPFDIMIRYHFNGLVYNVSLYTKNPDIDVSEIALKYKGGGHKAAAGFTCTHLPFKTLQKKFWMKLWEFICEI